MIIVINNLQRLHTGAVVEIDKSKCLLLAVMTNPALDLNRLIQEGFLIAKQLT